MILFTGRGYLANKYVEHFEASIESFRLLDFHSKRSLIQDASVLVHNAANLGNENLSKTIDDNFLLTKQIVDLCETYNPNIKLIYISSMSFLDVNGDYKKVQEMSPYAYSKFLAETYCLKSSLEKKTSVRFSTIFYKDALKDGLSKLISDSFKSGSIVLQNEGKSKRDFIPLEICVRYLKLIIDKQLTDQIVNICSGVETSFMEVAVLLNQINPDYKIINIEAETRQAICSHFDTKDIKILGEIKFSLEDEILNFLSGLKDEGSRI